MSLHGFGHTYAGNPLDRGEVERRNEHWIASRALDPSTRLIPARGIDFLLNFTPEPSLVWFNAKDSRHLYQKGSELFLGLDGDVAYFTAPLSDTNSLDNLIKEKPGLQFVDARTAATVLSAKELGIMAQAKEQLHWHNTHRFCPVCGGQTTVGRGGQVRICKSCAREHFPRTDPVVIVVVSNQRRCLLGQSRGRLASMNMYSALAGFMDHGECIEEAVAREVREEAGIEVKNVRYHSSQPWPFPYSLMIGCHAEAASTEIKVDRSEMTDVRWFEKADVVMALKEVHKDLRLPQPMAIAHHLIKSWAEGVRY